MRIAVTGGSGRVGRAVVSHALAAGHSVVSVDRVPFTGEAEVESIQAELTDYASFERALQGCDALIHLAAIPSPRGFPDYEVHNNNVVSSYNALSAAVHVGISRVCQASSINATGAAYSRWPRYDYFPLDEQHPTYNEDAYSLSKWICEQQADSFARRYEQMSIASLRFHAVVPSRAAATEREHRPDPERGLAKNLWAYTELDAAARACMLSLEANLVGHEAFYIVSPSTMMSVPSLELRDRFFPSVPVRGQLTGNQGFYSTRKAERLLGWQHDQAGEAERAFGATA